MEIVDLNDIIIPDNRQRKHFDEAGIDELAESILDKGLMHPIVIRDDGRTLVAGERRLRALSRLFERGLQFDCNGQTFLGAVPCTRLGDLTPLQVLEAELEENTIRIDLAWQERSEAIARLHGLREKQAEVRGEEHLKVDSARELLSSIGVEATPQATSGALTKVSRALLLNEHMEDPDVAGAKTEKEALKIIEKKAAKLHRERLAAELGNVSLVHTFHQGDAFEILPQLEGPFDLMITDPPYGIEADKFGDQAAMAHEYKDDIQFAIQCYALCFSNADRLGARAIFTFCDIRVHPTLVEMAKQLLPSWAVWDTPLIWAKGNGMLPVPDRGPRRTYEGIFYAYRNSTQWATTGSPDIVEVPSVSSPQFGAEKPIPLYSDLLSRVALPGDRVIDPFAGTCPVIGAADELQLTATVIELNKEKLDYATVRYTEA